MERFTQKQLLEFKERFINKQLKIKKNDTFSYLQIVDIITHSGKYYIIATDGVKDSLHNFILGLENSKISRLDTEEFNNVSSYYNEVLAKADAEKVEEQRKRDLM